MKIIKYENVIVRCIYDDVFSADYSIKIFGITIRKIENREIFNEMDCFYLTWYWKDNGFPVPENIQRILNFKFNMVNKK